MSDTRPRNQTSVSGPTSVRNPYPESIKISLGAERYLEQLGADLLTGEVELHQLSPALLQLYTFAFEQGRASVMPALEKANADADRLYAEVCRRIPPKQNDHQSFAALSRIRGEEERAQRAEERTAYIQATTAAEAARLAIQTSGDTRRTHLSGEPST
jgi:hypothetical protein